MTIDNYVIMPNHIHLMISILIYDDGGEMENFGGMKASRPTVCTIIRSLKTMVTKKIGYSIWQNSFYDHIIRDEREYLDTWRYIDENPLKWQEDRFFVRERIK